jgi:hypothetical protein
MEQFLIDVLGAAESVGIDPAALVPGNSRLQSIAAKIEAAIVPLLSFDDPRGIYAHCLCEITN